MTHRITFYRCSTPVYDGLLPSQLQLEEAPSESHVAVTGYAPVPSMEDITVLRSLEIFRAVPDAELRKVASLVRGKEVQAGEEIIREGDMGTSMFIIVEGRVRVHAQGTEIAILGSGNVVGELAALDPEIRTASATALNDTFLFEIEGDALWQLLSERVSIARGLVRALCRRVRSTLPK
jgi:CRP-like cAMP-binding protein